MKIDRRCWLGVCAFSLVSCFVAAAEKRPRDHDIVAEDYFTLGTISNCVMSPDGMYVVWSEMRWNKTEDERNTDLWVTSTQTRKPLRLTFDMAADSSPQWSADGRWIYFTSSRRRAGEEKPPYDGKRQVWRVAATGGEVTPVTRLPDGIAAYQLARDGGALYYTVTTEHIAEDAWKELRKDFGDLKYGHGVVAYSELWRLDLARWRSEKLIDEKRVIKEFTVSRDERRIAMITTPTGDLIANEGWSRIDVREAATGEITALPDRKWRADAPSPYGWLSGLTWSSDGEALAFRVDFDGYPGEMFVVHHDRGDEVLIQKLARPNEVTAMGHLAWIPDSRDLCFMAEDHARLRVYRVREIDGRRQGPTTVLTPGDVCVDTFDLSRDGDRMAFVMSDVTHPPDVFVVSTGGSAAPFQRITHVNPQVDDWKLPSVQTVKWKSADGTEVEGILELPPDYQAGTTLPTVVVIHGGPTASARLRLRFWIYGRVLFAARGWATLSPNYRGSTGFGDKFLTDLIGHKNDLDVADILSGVDALVERGIADPDRLAVMGWSNGGYLTNCLITRTNRFKAAISGAGVFDTVMQWLTEDTPGHVINFNGGFPWNRSEEMRRGSALYNIDKAKTPTLIHVGENDRRCPPGHSRGLYRALRHYLDVPCELVVYPGAGHGLTTYTHRKAKMAWDLKWFEHYVLNKTTTEEEPSPSPID